MGAEKIEEGEEGRRKLVREDGGEKGEKDGCGVGRRQHEERGQRKEGRQESKSGGRREKRKRDGRRMDPKRRQKRERRKDSRDIARDGKEGGGGMGRGRMPVGEEEEGAEARQWLNSCHCLSRRGSLAGTGYRCRGCLGSVSNQDPTVG